MLDDMWPEVIKRSFGPISLDIEPDDEDIYLPPDFATHLNYINYLKEISKGLTMEFKLAVINSLPDDPEIKRKYNLIKLTRDSLDFEHDAIRKNPEYASVCASWISVKAYYMVFNLCLILKYLISGGNSVFNLSHAKILNEVKRCLKEGELVFSEGKFNAVQQVKTTFAWKSKIGSALKFNQYDFEERFRSILKKLAFYQLEEYKRVNKIKNFRKMRDKGLRRKFLDEKYVCLCEFFYWYRIKANYRDLEYLDKSIAVSNFKDYYCSYYELTLNFYNAFKNLINDLSYKRFSRKVFA